MTPQRRTASVIAAPLATLFTVASLALIAGCASTRVDAQWSDPQLAPNVLRGARVMIACEAYEMTLKRICQDQLAAEVVARGATPVIAPDTTNPAPGRPLGDSQYLGPARDAGARAVLTSIITPAAMAASPGLSIGIGGFSFGGHGGAGVGVSAPIGGGQMATGFAADSRLTDTASGRLLWSARATSPPSPDVQTQMTELAKAVFGAVDKAGLF